MQIEDLVTGGNTPISFLYKIKPHTSSRRISSCYMLTENCCTEDQQRFTHNQFAAAAFIVHTCLRPHVSASTRVCVHTSPTTSSNEPHPRLRLRLSEIHRLEKMEHLLLILLMAGFFPHSSTARSTWASSQLPFVVCDDNTGKSCSVFRHAHLLQTFYQLSIYLSLNRSNPVCVCEYQNWL